MKISKKQYKFIELLERCSYLVLSEINNQEYPASLIDALIEKELIFEVEGMVASTTKII